ncbi:PleD family two-component system response regulator [Pedobacter gandavensis]|uniref:response regulator n=1 Tax=Pedobacter gandavensis TaxID=2679963 RepID=UPI00292E73EE|nr:response regulator [Pedobacter gandavensis]
MKNIFIADDDAAIVDATSMMLELMGYQIKSTLKGSEVLTAMESVPDLLLLDIWLSGVDGRDICKQLKSDPKTKNLPILMISASREIKASALASGADDFLAKPFDMQSLLKKIENLVSQ